MLVLVIEVVEEENAPVAYTPGSLKGEAAAEPRLLDPPAKKAAGKKAAKVE